MNDITAFGKRCKEKAKLAPQAAHRIKCEVAEAVLTELVQSTPVDTTTAESNWQVGINAPAPGPIGAKAPGHKGSTRAVSAAETIAEGVQAIRASKPGEAIHISNSLPYINRLNEGSSSQAPAGMTDRATQVGRAVIQRSKPLDK